MALSTQILTAGFGAQTSYSATAATFGSYDKELAKRVFGKDPLMQPMKATWMDRFDLIGEMQFDVDRPEFRASDTTGSAIIRAQNFYAQPGGADSIQCPVNLYEEVNDNSGFVGHWLSGAIRASTYGFQMIGKEGTIYQAVFAVRLNKWIDPKVIMDDAQYREGLDLEAMLEKNLHSRLREFLDRSAARALLWGIDPMNIRAMYGDYTTGGDYAPRAHPNRIFGKNKNGGIVGVWQNRIDATYGMDTNDVIDKDWCLEIQQTLYRLNVRPVRVGIKMSGYETLGFSGAYWPVLCPVKAYFQAKGNLLVQNNVVQPMARAADGKGAMNDIYGVTPVEYFVYQNFLFILVNKLPERLYKLAYDCETAGTYTLTNSLSSPTGSLTAGGMPVVNTFDDGSGTTLINNALANDDLALVKDAAYAYIDSGYNAIATAATKYYLQMTSQSTYGLFGVIDNGNVANCHCFREVVILGEQSLFIGDDGGGVNMAVRGISDYDEVIGKALKVRVGKGRYDVKPGTGNTITNFVDSTLYSANQVWLNYSSATAIVYTGYQAV